MLRIDNFKAASLLYLAALFLFVTLFGPYALYAANQSEFQSSFAALIPPLLNWRVGGLALLALVRSPNPNRYWGQQQRDRQTKDNYRNTIARSYAMVKLKQYPKYFGYWRYYKPRNVHSAASYWGVR